MESKRGITLVSLIVTIIVLLILAGVVINLTIGNKGIFNRAKNAVDLWEEASRKEEEELNNIIGIINQSGDTNGEENKNNIAQGNATEEDVLEGKTFSNDEKIGTVGTMKDRGELIWNPSGSEEKTVEPGFYSGGLLSSQNAYNKGLADGKSSAMNILYYGGGVTYSVVERNLTSKAPYTADRDGKIIAYVVEGSPTTYTRN